MSNLQTTMGAMQDMLAGVPDAPGAWVPLRRATVEAALQHLRDLQTVVDALRYLGYAGEQPSAYVDVQPTPAPAWRYPVMSAEEVAAAAAPANGNVTLPDAVVRTNGHSHAAAPARHTKPTNGWRRMAKEERLELVLAEIARQAGERTWLTQSEFDRDKPEMMPSASSMTATLGLTWIGLVSQALPRAVVPAAQPGRPGRPPVAKEPSAAPAAEPFREAAAED